MSLSKTKFLFLDTPWICLQSLELKACGLPDISQINHVLLQHELASDPKGNHCILSHSDSLSYLQARNILCKESIHDKLSFVFLYLHHNSQFFSEKNIGHLAHRRIKVVLAWDVNRQATISSEGHFQEGRDQSPITYIVARDDSSLRYQLLSCSERGFKNLKWYSSIIYHRRGTQRYNTIVTYNELKMQTFASSLRRSGN